LGGEIKPVKSLLSFAIATSLILSSAGAELVLGPSPPIYAPEATVIREGNTNTLTPFFSGPGRYQQIFAASEFMALTNYGHGWLDGFWFIGDRLGKSLFAFRIPSMQVTVSTTTRGPDNLSPVFEENTGTNQVTVFSGAFEGILVGGSTPDFGFNIRFSKYYVYDPKSGNLLVDIRILAGNTSTNICDQFGRCIPPFFDAESADDSVASVYSPSVFSGTGSVQTIGLRTEVSLQFNSHLEITRTNSAFNSALLRWSTFPRSFVLQRATGLGAQPDWQPVTSEIETSPDGYIRMFTVFGPTNAGSFGQYFRLVSPPP
jgi:hypothetical protein